MHLGLHFHAKPGKDPVQRFAMPGQAADCNRVRAHAAYGQGFAQGAGLAMAQI